MSDLPRGLSRFATIFFVVCLLLVGYLLVLILRPFFSILIWATVLTVVFWPLYGRILPLCRGRRTWASFVTCLVILLLIVVPVTVLGIMVTQQSISLYHVIQSNLEEQGGSRYRPPAGFPESPLDAVDS